MAEQTITERSVNSHGSLKMETGVFTASGTSDLQIKTKLGRILFVTFAGLGTTSDNIFESYINSVSQSAVEDDPGSIQIHSGAASGGVYSYQAIGVG